eukprot:TRINITY_DN10803_c0_g1_i1.p1 TRINITY_DN10803_c0_g1~~TRINITY_DN10803_c0_g1_i1.p1  ORF type:complete len:816 (-),score=122.60 TRINITY_DN10803_c0_g1_i1:50-2497(-)
MSQGAIDSHGTVAVVAEGTTQSKDDAISQLHWDGWVALPKGRPAWDVCDFAERHYKRYHQRIVDMLAAWKKDWWLADKDGDAPGANRVGGLVARWATQELEGTGVFVYAAHPSQADDEEDEDNLSGPRWYVTIMEAAMQKFGPRGVAPPPPAELQDLMWPRKEDRRRPWLTELGWTICPAGSDPQIMHADICCPNAPQARQPGIGRYHHMAWKLDSSEFCTTNIVPGAFTEGEAGWDHYGKWRTVRAPALIFDSEMLHRGGATKPGKGFSSTLTVQVSSGSGWGALTERVSDGLMWYTQRMGWENGDAVDVILGDSNWYAATILERNEDAVYSIALEGSTTRVEGFCDNELRYREHLSDDSRTPPVHAFRVGKRVQVLHEGVWFPAKISRCNGDGTYRVVWRDQDRRSFTDGVPGSAVKRLDAAEAAVESGGGVKRKSPDTDEESTTDSSGGGGNAKRRSPATETTSSEDDSSDVEARRVALFKSGSLQLKEGIPPAWRQWEVFAFVEACFDRFNQVLIDELESLRSVWAPCRDSYQRHGAFAAEKVNQRLKPHGVALYSPGPSQSEEPPYESTGPRWYVSVTPAAIQHFGGLRAPGLPAEMHRLLCGHPADCVANGEPMRARGLGWTLAPAGSDPQALHADLYGTGMHKRRNDRTRWPHMLWKRDASQMCTTQVVPAAYTDGAVWAEHFDKVVQVRAPAILVDSEVLHRGAPTPPPFDGKTWVSTLSLEMCTPSGWAAWEAFETGGTTKETSGNFDWRMLEFAGGSNEPAADRSASAKVPFSGAASVQLPPAPWATDSGRKALHDEQRAWELSA